MPTSTSEVYPLTFDPILKSYTWGGRNLKTRLGRKLPEGNIAESWEIAGHANGASLVNRGPLAGKTLTEVLALWGEQLLGSRNRVSLATERFPLLIKLLDAHRWLSVQVHPDDRYALEHENDLGKTEMWVVLHAEPDAQVIFGFQEEMTRKRLAEAVAADRTNELLHFLPVQAGDVVFVPAGALHALGPGLIIAEIQQNSDTTYRLYDWGRDRPIHVEQALQVLDYTLVQPGVAEPVPVSAEDGARREILAECPYFRTERITLDKGAAWSGMCDGETFEIWGVISGAVTLATGQDRLELPAVQWTLLPAALGAYTIQPQEKSVLLRVFTPDGSS